MTEIGVINVGMTGNHGYKYEGVEFRVLANQEEGTTALNRYWSADGTDHFYTTNLKEINVTEIIRLKTLRMNFDNLFPRMTYSYLTSVRCRHKSCFTSAGTVLVTG